MRLRTVLLLIFRLSPDPLPRLARCVTYCLPTGGQVGQFHDSRMLLDDVAEADESPIFRPIRRAAQKLPVPFRIMAYQQDRMRPVEDSDGGEDGPVFPFMESPRTLPGQNRLAGM